MTASAYHVISKEADTLEFLDAHVNINNPHWQRSGIIKFFYKYYIVIGDTLAVFFLDVLFLLLAGILSELYEKLTKNKDWITKKKYREEFVWVTSLLWLHAHLSMSFLLLSLSTSLPKWRSCWMAPIKIHDIAIGGILCNTSWLTSLRMQYYFRTFLASVVHTLNCYSFLLTFLLKTKTCKIVVGNCGSSIYC